MHEVLGFDDDVMVWGGDYTLDWAGPLWLRHRRRSACDAGCGLRPDTPVDEIFAELGTRRLRTGWSST